MFQLADLLIKPIQRIQKYHLLVKKILSYSENANAPANVIAALRDAVRCTSIIPKNANDMMDVGRLQGFTVTLFDFTFLWNMMLVYTTRHDFLFSCATSSHATTLLLILDNGSSSTGSHAISLCVKRLYQYLFTINSRLFV